MLAHDIPAIYNKLTVVNGELKVVASEISLREVFNSGALDCGDLDFRFETRYEPYQEYSFDTIDGIDLVVKSADGRFLSPEALAYANGLENARAIARTCGQCV